MGGGLIQLVATGAQDVYLTGDPQVTFFKTVYKRHTNFSTEPMQQQFNDLPELGRSQTCRINKNGDLVTKMYLVMEMTQVTSTVSWGYVKNLAHAIIQDIELKIGGTRVDYHTDDWLNIWYQLSKNSSHLDNYAKMIGDVSSLTNMTTDHSTYKLYLPLQFWFNRNNGLALPLIALQHHDVDIIVSFKEALNIINYQGNTEPTNLPSINDAYILTDYVYLDSEERRLFAESRHEYLIEQVQFNGTETVINESPSFRLQFNHPSKFLTWTLHLDRFKSKSQFLVWAGDGDWDAAKTLFAKLVWLACRVTGTNSDGDLIITISGSNTNPLEIPANNFSTTSKIMTINNKIKGMILFTNSSSEADATPDNVAIISHTITSEDISFIVSELYSSSDILINQTYIDALVQKYQINVLDHFNYGNYIDGTDNPITSSNLQLNGHDRFQENTGRYFNVVQPYQHFSSIPEPGINVYSFAINPEQHQPSGTCNFSRIDDCVLFLKFGLESDSTKNFNYISLNGAIANELNIFATNYNVFRIMSGLGAMAYSN